MISETLWHYVIVFLGSMVPVVELRVAIPFGVSLGLPLLVSTVLGVCGSWISIFLAMWVWPRIIRIAESHIPFLHRFLQRIFEKTRTKHSKKILVLGEIFLITFVAVPIPGSGVWMGTLVAYLFHLKQKPAFFCISLGVLIAGLIMSGLSFVGVEALDSFR